MEDQSRSTKLFIPTFSRTKYVPLCNTGEILGDFGSKKTAHYAIQPLQYYSFYKLFWWPHYQSSFPNSLARSKPRAYSSGLLVLGLCLGCSSSRKPQDHCQTDHKRWNILTFCRGITQDQISTATATIHKRMIKCWENGGIHFQHLLKLIIFSMNKISASRL